MLLSEMIIRSKLIPPKPHQEPFRRPRLDGRLSDSHQYPITLVHAGTGFGKTTALVELGKSYPQVYWYHITEPDRDPSLFFAHLLAAFSPGTDHLLTRLEQGGIPPVNALLASLINHLTTVLEEEAVLVLDDYHLVCDIPEINRWLEQLVEQCPPLLHIAAASRQIPGTPGFIRWRVKGSILVIDQTDLSFNVDEIATLFSEHYRYPITLQQAEALYAYTGGWIIALQMIWQRLQNSREKKLDSILAHLPSALSDVFTFLAQEVLMRQPADVQRFLLSSSILRQMDAQACNALLDISNSQELLEMLNGRGLFLLTVDHAIFRFQRLFQDFLLARAAADGDDIRRKHLRAAEHYSGSGNDEEAIYHLLAAGDQANAASLISAAGPAALAAGRLGTLANWVEQVEKAHRDSHPELHLLLGDCLRLNSEFDAALDCYAEAEKIYSGQNNHPGRSRALRSQAKVYLDTIRPLRASSLLMQAMSLLEPQEYPHEVAELLDLLAENKLNLGKPDEARALHQEANLLRVDTAQDDIYLESRALLRTGRLKEACTLIENSGGLADAAPRPQRFHREMSLLLSLVYLMRGNYDLGTHYAREGIKIGRQLDSPFVEAVGWMRLGHASQHSLYTPWLKETTWRAREYYERSIGLVKPFKVVRVQVEPLWGLTRLYGYTGNIQEARRYAITASDIAASSGDMWFVALIDTTLGISLTMAGEAEAAESHLLQARDGFIKVGDMFGEAVAGSARILNLWRNGSQTEALAQFAGLAPRFREGDLAFLLTGPSHLGFPDGQVFLPVLVEAQRNGIEPAWLDEILQGLQLEGADYHPGYSLYASCLGGCEAWRGAEPINPRDWQREKARQLFQFFISGRGKWHTREQIADRLWPDLDADSATQNFKVALNALNHALEPDRESGRTPFFISRRDTLYGLNPAASIHLDTDDFTRLCQSAEEDDLQTALQLYGGDFLEESAEESWSKATRDRVRDLFIQTGMRLADCAFAEGRWDDAIKAAHRVLDVDACHEPAYQYLMKSHAALGSRSTVHSVYQRCAAELKEELDVQPSPETTRLWQSLCR